MEKTRSAGAAVELISSQKWGASGVRQACKPLQNWRTGISVNLSRGGTRKRGKQRKDKHSGPASHISVRGSYKHPARLRITEHRPNKT